MKEERPAKLFKYYSPERVDVLENLRVCFSSHSQLNDAFEGISQIRNPIGKNEITAIENYISPQNLHELAVQKITDHFVALGKSPRIARKLAIKQLERREIRDEIATIKHIFPTAVSALAKFAENSDTIDKSTESIGIFSMSEIENSSIMWGIYGATFSGFVIEFNLDDSFFYNNNKFRAKKVIYELREVNGILAADETDFFLRKSEEWEHEHEWRILSDRQKADYTLSSGHALFNIQSSTVKNVIVGYKMSEIERRIIYSLSEKYNWLIREAKPNRNKMQIDIYDI